ncbi:hypothetical protein FIV07_28135 (plasmid) [Mycobacterium sp. THAF192]|nr:hypothetical protein FIV07_28135 [Mycobacterium sp. THAF192]
MSVPEELLAAMQQLFGDGGAAGVSHSAKVREQAPPAVPANWESSAAERLAETDERLQRVGEDFAATDDAVSARVDAVSSAVRDAASQLARIGEDHRISRARLSALDDDPEIAARIAELDRVRVQDGANTVKAAQVQIGGVFGTG